MRKSIVRKKRTRKHIIADLRVCIKTPSRRLKPQQQKHKTCLRRFRPPFGMGPSLRRQTSCFCCRDFNRLVCASSLATVMVCSCPHPSRMASRKRMISVYKSKLVTVCGQSGTARWTYWKHTSLDGLIPGTTRKAASLMEAAFRESDCVYRREAVCYLAFLARCLRRRTTRLPAPSRSIMPSETELEASGMGAGMRMSPGNGPGLP